MATPPFQETDEILINLARRIDNVEALIEKREMEGVSSANFMESSVNYVSLEQLEERRVELNRRYQQRRLELQGLSLAFGRYVTEEDSGLPTKV